eukprot:Skav235759  [mRNA]  locus=scaffold803:339740:344194:+ [translate_table: standard]
MLCTVGWIAIGAWILGIAGVVLMLMSWLTPLDWRFLSTGIVCYVLYLVEMCCSKPCKYLSNIHSEASFVKYIEKLQKASPTLELQCFKEDFYRRNTTDEQHEKKERQYLLLG